MRNKKWKKMQSKINKIVRTVNKNIYNDDLWLGRFYIKQIKSEFEEYEDKSGGSVRVWLKFIDRKTKLEKNEILDFIGSPFFDYDLFLKMNDFITGYVDVWHREDNPYKNKIDFRKERF